VNRWRTYAFLLFANWIKDVYHDSPFDLSTLPSLRR
jgi:homoserine trans-succinylase